MSARNDTCNLGPDFWTVLENFQYFVYGLLPFATIVVGLPGHAILFFVFYISSKKEKAYGYQIYSAISDTLELVFSCNISLFSVWTGVNNGGVASIWFTRRLPLMWYSAHLCTFFLSSADTNSLLVSLSMSVDRCLAIGAPTKYKSFNHRRNQSIAFVCCGLISVITSIFDCFRFSLGDNSETYSLIRNRQFAESTFALVSARLRDTIRIGGLFALILFNAAVVYFYKKRGQALTQLTSNDATKEEKRKKQEKTLLLLSVSQSLLIAVRLFSQTALLIVVFGVPEYTRCGQDRLFACVSDCVTQTSIMLNFYIFFACSKQFRTNVSRAFPCTKKLQTTINPAV